MGCTACGGGAAAQEAMVAMSNSFARSDGTFSLVTYPDCAGGYVGKHEGLSVYIVGRNTSIERLFGRDPSEYAAAVEYMNSFGVSEPRPTIERIPTVQLCQQAVEDVLG